MNGAELIVRIRKVDPQARVILLSGQVEALALTAENTGADAVLAKSAGEAAQLARTIKRLLNRPAARKPPASQKAPAPQAKTAGR
jgi:DNA-binding NarL/FixJ family response regulator